MNWFLYDNGLRHERVKSANVRTFFAKNQHFLANLVPLLKAIV